MVLDLQYDILLCNFVGSNRSSPIFSGNFCMLFQVMKKELKHREQAWARVQWELVGPLKSIRTLQGRLVGTFSHLPHLAVVTAS